MVLKISKFMGENLLEIMYYTFQHHAAVVVNLTPSRFTKIFKIEDWEKFTFGFSRIIKQRSIFVRVFQNPQFLFCKLTTEQNKWRIHGK